MTNSGIAPCQKIHSHGAVSAPPSRLPLTNASGKLSPCSSANIALSR